MPPERQVYLLNPQELSPEVIAVAFAKTSRSPESFREIAAELNAEKSAAFHERWVVGYGHASVAEHAVLHIAVENVSRLAVETLESNRLASYTEKSTRYQKWGAEDFYLPPELEGQAQLKQEYIQACQRLFSAYQNALPAVRQVISDRAPRQVGETEAAYERRIRSDYVDVCRFILPAASLANVGITINARALEHALRKMLSHPLEEVRLLGQEIKQVARQEVPTLIKYADAVPYLVESRQTLARMAPAAAQAPAAQDWCRLVHFDPGGEERLLAAALFRFNQEGFAQNLARVQQMPAAERQKLAYHLIGTAGKYDIPLRELEHSSFTFEVTLDQGAYFELKRHRMMTQTAQGLTTRLGYALPRAMIAAGVEKEYRLAMEQASQSYERLAEFDPEVAAYLVPNAYYRRVLLTFNLRCAEHFVALRSAPNAHFSIRRVAHRIGAEIRKAAPLLGSYLRESPGETWQDVEKNYFG